MSHDFCEKFTIFTIMALVICVGTWIAVASTCWTNLELEKAALQHGAVNRGVAEFRIVEGNPEFHWKDES